MAPTNRPGQMTSPHPGRVAYARKGTTDAPDRRGRTMGKLIALISVLSVLPFAGTTPERMPAAGDPLYSLTETAVLAEVATDGRVAVTEKHTFAWHGPAHGAYLDIPLDSRVHVENVSVSEGDTAYRLGPDAAVGVNRPAGTYGTACCDDDRQRVAWYFSAAPGSTNTFTIRYTLRGAVTAHDDQAFLSLPVWGENWPEQLDLLRVEIRLPRDRDPGAGVLESAEDPALTVNAATRTATLTERRIAPGQARTVELAFPRGLIDADPAGADVAGGSGSARLDRMRTSYDDPVVLATIGVIAGSMLLLIVCGLISHLLSRRRAARSPGRGAHSYGGYSGSGSSSGYYGGGGSSTGGGGGGAW
ncbi:DUF2207 domain-containing protein [Nonomuraea phyllanthi]|uniref:DUF2207 domain-containing protein n=1 Tax=Nonomuraea phyllanthi TaxID=2219224 RepID=A0A5C4W3X6_9ACTN|nr:DUF2207 domain-containing protein [Nonomuraea phyllanthi]